MRSQGGECGLSILTLALRFAVAAVLGLAALAKARSFGDFRRTVEALTYRGATPLAAAVVAAEATLAVLLAAGVLPTAVAAAALILFLGFSALSLWALHSGLQVHCNCFGSGDRELGKESLATSALLAAATLGYLALLLNDEPSLGLGAVPVAVLLGITAALGGRWLLAAADVTAIVQQRRLLEKDLAG
jgi:uncharacterized membrane protein YphA (DoxX/SURF4 family)